MNLLQIQEVQQTQNKKNPKKSKPRHIIIKLLKIKVKKGIMKTTREKHHIVYWGTVIQLRADFSSETVDERRN